MAGLSGAELAAASAYMRPSAGDEAMVTSCVLGARAYLKSAGVSLPPAGGERRELYDLVCHSMALGSYDLRDPSVVGASISENPQLRKMLVQLRQTEPV
ncbi:MAG: phage gp6-like head-tail connector protein [Oscillospiraceae bacterium]